MKTMRFTWKMLLAVSVVVGNHGYAVGPMQTREVKMLPHESIETQYQNLAREFHCPRRSISAKQLIVALFAGVGGYLLANANRLRSGIEWLPQNGKLLALDITIPALSGIGGYLLYDLIATEKHQEKRVINTIRRFFAMSDEELEAKYPKTVVQTIAIHRNELPSDGNRAAVDIAAEIIATLNATPLCAMRDSASTHQ